MPPAVSQSALIRALNSTFAAALTRTIVIAMPVLAGAGLWASGRYFEQRVGEVPVVQQLAAEREVLQTIIEKQDERLRTLEEGRRANAALIATTTENAARQSAKLDRIDATLNRMVGAFEARGLIPRQPQPLAEP
jgi:hypothetical protein